MNSTFNNIEEMQYDEIGYELNDELIGNILYFKT